MTSEEDADSMGDTISSLSKSNSKNSAAHEQDTTWHYEYITETGFFLQDAAATNPGTFDTMRVNFGLIEQDYDTDKLLPANGKDLTQWQRFEHKLKILNERAPKDVSYRLLYLGRHGQGFHNVGASFYGEEAWDCYYSALRNDVHVPAVQFFDARLTLLGEHQAKLVNQFWRRMITVQKIPCPQRYYCSPHTRALQTCRISFAGLPLPNTAPFRPLIKELLREGHGVHTCDSRDTRTYLQENFADFDIEKGFTETDELYSPIFREPPVAHTARMRLLLDDVMENDNSTYISMTAHHGTIAATLTAVGHRAFVLPTGGVIPVLVKVKKVLGPRPPTGNENVVWEGKPECTTDPLKAGKPGYKDIGEYLEEIERSVPRDEELESPGVKTKKTIG